MRLHTMRIARLVLAAGLAVALAAPAAPAVAGESNSSRVQTIKTVKTRYGKVIADGRGEVLYLFTKERGPRSECFGNCAYAWPPVLTKSKPRAGPGIDPDLLGTTRRRGKLLVTYAGHPLYYYVRDRPGLILCQNVFDYGGLWLVLNARGRAIRGY